MYARRLSSNPNDNTIQTLRIDGVEVVVVRDLDGMGHAMIAGRLLVEDQGDAGVTMAVARAAVAAHKKMYVAPLTRL